MTLKRPKAVLAQSLWGPWVLVCRRFCLSPPSVSGGFGVLILNVISPLLLSCCASLLPLDVGYFFFFFFLVGSNILLSVVVLQRAAILEFSQEKMRARSSTPPSFLFCRPPFHLLQKTLMNRVMVKSNISACFKVNCLSLT